MDCICRSLGAVFACDPERPFLGGRFVEVDRSADAALLRCADCGQVWRVDTLGGERSLAFRLETANGWREVDVSGLRVAHGAKLGRSPNKLPVLSLLRDSAKQLWNGRGALLGLAALPFVALATFEVGRVLWFGASDEGPVMDTVLGALAQVPLAYFSVRWCRFLLLGPGGRLGRGWGRREWWWWVWAAGFEVVSTWNASTLQTGFVIEPSLATVGIATLLALALLYPNARLSPILTAVAVDSFSSLRRGWALSAGNGWRLVGLELLAVLATGLPLWPLLWLSGLLGGSELAIAVGALASSLVALSTTAVLVAIGALAYRWLATPRGSSS